MKMFRSNRMAHNNKNCHSVEIEEYFLNNLMLRRIDELKLHLENQLMHCLQILIVILSAIPCDQQCFETSLNSLDLDKVYPRIWCCDYKALAV